MNNPYETLGVPRNASQDTIKAAFRMLASANHPDRKDGDSAKMAEINSAYAILSDPERKANFDTTGQLFQPPSMEQEANNTLIQLFTQLLDVEQGKLLTTARSSILASKGNANSAVSRLRNRTVALTARRESITTKDGVNNLVQSLIDQQIQCIAQNIEQATKALAVLELAEKMLDYYESSEPEIIQPVYWGSTGSTTTTVYRVVG